MLNYILYKKVNGVILGVRVKVPNVICLHEKYKDKYDLYIIAVDVGCGGGYDCARLLNKVIMLV